MRLAEGADITDRQTLVVEDAITTGGQVVASVKELRNLGALVSTVVCVIDRSRSHDLLHAANVEVHSLFTASDIP